jgi:hypothetical protein
MGLADDVVQRVRAQALGERRVRVERGLGGGGVEEVLGAH